MIKTLTTKIAILALLFIPSTLLAATVVISEVGFRSTASIDDYVELYNTTGSAINLSGYTLVPSTGSPVTLTGTIPANGFYVIGKNTTETSFEASWGVTIGGTSVYENSGNVLSTSAGVTFTLKNSGGTAIDNTTGYGVTLGTRLYQCPVGSFLGNTTSLILDCTPGGVESLSVDDITHWDLAFIGAWANGDAISATTLGKNAIIRLGKIYPVTSNQINDLKMLEYTSLLVLSGHNFNISGNLYMEKTSSIIVTVNSGSTTVSGTITMNQESYPVSSVYNLWSTPLSSPISLISVFNGVNPCDIYTYQATFQEWKADFPNGFSTICNGNSVTFGATNILSATDGVADGNMDICRGYFIPGGLPSSRTFSGSSFNNGAISVPIYGSSEVRIDGNDWNIIGNPYPSGLLTQSFLNNVNNASLINAVYVYQGNINSYITYNTSNVAYISSFQGFTVDGNSITDGLLGNLEFENSMRTRSNSNFRSQNTVMFFSLNDGNNSDNIQVLMGDDLDDDYDKKFDAIKLLNGNNLNFASYIDTNLYVFNGIKTISNQQTKITKLFVQTPSPGAYAISLDSLNLVDDHLEIILEDKNSNSFTNLRTNSYTFNSASAESLTNRFFLHITNTITSINDINKPLSTSVYFSNGFINVKINSNSKIENVELFDLTGRAIYSASSKSNSIKINTYTLNSAVYLVKVTDEEGDMSTHRVFVK